MATEAGTTQSEPPQTAALIDAALVHVPFEGMNDRALVAGARDIGLAPGIARVLVPGGGGGLAAAYHRRGDRALRDWLAAHPPQGRFRDRVAAAVRRRLELSDPELVRAGAAVLALPGNAALGARLLAETADAIWSGLGDTSDDVAWWTKRASLAGVYGATALYWLGDRSEGHADTWAFLDRRIGEVMGFETLKARAGRLPGVGAAARLATGWIRAPRTRDLPGGSRSGMGGGEMGGGAA